MYFVLWESEVQLTWLILSCQFWKLKHDDVGLYFIFSKNLFHLTWWTLTNKILNQTRINIHFAGFQMWFSVLIIMGDSNLLNVFFGGDNFLFKSDMKDFPFPSKENCELEVKWKHFTFETLIYFQTLKI